MAVAYSPVQRTSSRPVLCRQNSRRLRIYILRRHWQKSDRLHQEQHRCGAGKEQQQDVETPERKTTRKSPRDESQFEVLPINFFPFDYRSILGLLTCRCD